MKNLLSPILVLFVLTSPGSFAANTPSYPGDDWESVAPESLQVDAAKLKKLDQYVFEETPNRHTDALVMIHQGKVVFEKYQYGYGPKMRHISWSMAKSVTAILIGIAESEGLISRNSKMVDFYPYPASSPEEAALRNQVTVMSLLTMSSGIQWVEDYTKKAPLRSDVTQMLYMNPRYDMGAYVASRPMESKPDDHYYYSTGNTTLAMAMLRHQMSSEAYNQYPWQKLFDKIGMKQVVMEQDGAGSFGGGSYVYATARDYARFGYLLMNGGKWNDNQLVPQEWMRVIRQVSPGQTTGSIQPEGDKTYGAGFWLNQKNKWSTSLPFPAAPEDLFFALGHNGQSIAIIPSQDLVVVRLAHDSDPGIDLNEYFGLLSGAVKRGLRSSSISTASATLPTALPPRAGELPLAPAKRQSLIYLPKLIASVRAKDFCSCHFVIGQTVEFCEAQVKNGFPEIRMRVNEGAKQVTFGITPSQTAEVTSETLGCSFL